MPTPQPTAKLGLDAEAALALRHVDNYHRADMTETWLDGVTVLLRDNWRKPWVKTHDVDHWWLVVDGVAVAYLHTMVHLTRDEFQHVLCDIEVRDGHRGHGYARRVVEAVHAAYGAVLHTTGNFTPLGAQALGWVPVLPWEVYDVGVKYADMPFVQDWDNLLPINAL